MISTFTELIMVTTGLVEHSADIFQELKKDTHNDLIQQLTLFSSDLLSTIGLFSTVHQVVSQPLQ